MFDFKYILYIVLFNEVLNLLIRLTIMIVMNGKLMIKIDNHTDLKMDVEKTSSKVH